MAQKVIVANVKRLENMSRQVENGWNVLFLSLKYFVIKTNFNNTIFYRSLDVETEDASTKNIQKNEVLNPKNHFKSHKKGKITKISFPKVPQNEKSKKIGSSNNVSIVENEAYGESADKDTCETNPLLQEQCQDKELIPQNDIG